MNMHIKMIKVRVKGERVEQGTKCPTCGKPATPEKDEAGVTYVHDVWPAFGKKAESFSGGCFVPARAGA
jgi:hypothetical protein